MIFTSILVINVRARDLRILAPEPTPGEGVLLKVKREPLAVVRIPHTAVGPALFLLVDGLAPDLAARRVACICSLAVRAANGCVLAALLIEEVATRLVDTLVTCNGALIVVTRLQGVVFRALFALAAVLRRRRCGRVPGGG